MSNLMNQEGNSSINKPSADASLIEIRLRTEPILKQIEVFLSGEKIETTLVNNQLIAYKVKVGQPKANRQGITSILNWIANVLNSQVVQGNFYTDKSGFSKEYEDFCYNFRIDFGDELMINLYKYGINEEDFMGIIDSIMNIIVPFMPRLKDNKERESYYKTLESKETSNTMSKDAFPTFLNRR